MESTRKLMDEEEIDAQAQLAMLASVQNATEVEAWMPATPVWHAPLLAASIAGFAVFSGGPDGWQMVALVIGVAALLIGVVDQRRRQGVSPRRTRKPLRVIAFYGVVAFVTYCTLALWSLVDWSPDLRPRPLTLLGAWLATTLLFAVGITITNRMRGRWIGSAR
ncbi:MAG: hypothetical protein ACRBK7_06975 [Acidimicrobiales bacterium]